MAKYETKTPKDEDRYVAEYKQDYMSDWDIHRNYIQTFDAYEAMLIGQVYDSVSNSVDGSKITDSYATTLAKERADRVMAKLPEGQTVPIGKADVGKAAFMDILRQKWIYPNANAQHPFQEKLNMWQLYSSVYGYMPMFYDWNVSNSGYIGPDCWLWNPRNLVPQQGRTSIEDMDYVTAITWVSKKYLEDILEDQTSNDDGDDNKENMGGWDLDALKLLIEKANMLSDRDTDKDTKIARDRQPQAVKKGVQLATRYESGPDGEWCTFAPDFGYIEVRKIKNPHKNGRIPFVVKYSQPLFDSFYGLGDFQRAKPLQFARDGLTNFYFKGIKMNLIPPIIANANGVMKHTLDYREGAVMLETIPNSIRRLETSTAGLATYQAAQSNLTGSLLSLYGSQNAAIPGADSLNPSQGKTPQAISLYSDKEATRDGSERRHLEAAIEQLTDGFFSLVVNIGTEDIPVTLFADDIEDIRKSGGGDIEELFKGIKPDKSQSAGTLKINPAKLKGVEYRFNIAGDSTAKTNQDAQRQALEQWMAAVGKLQNVIQSDPTVKVNWPKIMEVYGKLIDIPDVDEFVTVDPNAKPPEPPQQQPSPTVVQTDGGQLHESADLVKLFVATEDLSVKNAILQMMGLPPMQAPPAIPTVAASGHAFNDPTLAAAADALHVQGQAQLAPPPPPEAPQPEPNVTGRGLVFNDPTLAKSADALHTMNPAVPVQAPTNKS